MKAIRFGLTVTLLAIACTTTAGPAAWFKWQSKATGTTVCAQTSPGEGWAQLKGSYKDSRCLQSGKP